MVDMGLNKNSFSIDSFLTSIYNIFNYIQKNSEGVFTTDKRMGSFGTAVDRDWLRGFEWVLEGFIQIVAEIEGFKSNLRQQYESLGSPYDSAEVIVKELLESRSNDRLELVPKDMSSESIKAVHNLMTKYSISLEGIAGFIEVMYGAVDSMVSKRLEGKE